MDRPVLIIKTGNTIDSLLARDEDFEDWFALGLALGKPSPDLNAKLMVVESHRGETLPTLDKISGLIITGSPAYLTDLAAWNYEIADYVKLAHDAGVPQLGICYGHQLIAWTFGGEVGFHPAGREIGTVPVRLQEPARDDLLFGHMPAEFLVQASHLQSVLRLPDSAVLLGGNDFDPHHCFRIGEYTWCAQFHPEFDARIIRAYIKERAGDIAAEGLDPDRLLLKVQETPDSGSLLSRFMEIIRRREAQRS